MIQKLSTTADTFPATEVEYEDLLGIPYRVGGRVAAGDPGTDCIGVVLEIYRRAGLGLPDPGRTSVGVFGFAEVLEQVADPSALYDLVHLRRQSNHLAVQVRSGMLITATKAMGYWRVQDACLP